MVLTAVGHIVGMKTLTKDWTVSSTLGLWTLGCGLGDRRPD